MKQEGEKVSPQLKNHHRRSTHQPIVATACDLEPPQIHHCQLPVPSAQICVYGFGKRREERKEEKRGKEENRC
uniref:Uncharacterized protein n=1 Tax=Medicago truncatula TaxID=3880 RepID=A2Q479_MEDTR|nr:hypothetical protein MtrDRAFT_AC157375g12v1 [Medicago truncatula]